MKKDLDKFCVSENNLVIYESSEIGEKGLLFVSCLK